MSTNISQERPPASIGASDQRRRTDTALDPYRLTSRMSRGARWRFPCACKGSDTLTRRLHAIVMRHLHAAYFFRFRQTVVIATFVQLRERLHGPARSDPRDTRVAS
jgi:hypothetical protein